MALLSRRIALAATGLAGLTAPVLAVPRHRDAELLATCAEYMDAWAEDRRRLAIYRAASDADKPAADRAWEEAGEVCDRLLELIVATPALTLEGVVAKLRAIQTLRLVMRSDREPLDWTDEAADSVFADLERLPVVKEAH